MYMLIYVCLCVYTYVQKHIYIYADIQIIYLCISEMNDSNDSRMEGNNLYGKRI